ncbi:hypothetical protein DH2020_014704 [Rehmannia glutinosa]|uniref:Protein kinase domain-containing protein n=1 Tax=Rehmannia glutinosa TaxID=99300 RepID=A0ABR0X0I9_REHGL
METPSVPSILSDGVVRPIELKELKKATKHFLRADLFFEQGAWSPVLKAWIDEHTLTASKPGFGIPVTVKKWNAQGLQAYEEWSKELNYLSQLRHPNVVKLVGYCSEEDNMILVYEFLPRGSLDNYLFRRGHPTLPWAIRIKVAIGAARGLSFLHDKEKAAMHQIFTTATILLDGEYNAKLCNFSLARDGPTGDMTIESTPVMGAYSYAAPEYIATGQLTAKCDVYSFGVVLLELLFGELIIDRTRASKEHNVAEWAETYLRDKRKLLQVMDPKLEEQYPRNEAYNVVTIARQCLSTKPERRPRMAEVLVALEKLQGPIRCFLNKDYNIILYKFS